MSKIIARILENVTWLDELSSVLTVFFLLLFVFITIAVLLIRKQDIEEYKRIPLSEDDADNFTN